MNYRGNIKDAWHGLDVEATGKAIEALLVAKRGSR